MNQVRDEFDQNWGLDEYPLKVERISSSKTLVMGRDIGSLSKRRDGPFSILPMRLGFPSFVSAGLPIALSQSQEAFSPLATHIVPRSNRAIRL